MTRLLALPLFVGRDLLGPIYVTLEAARTLPRVTRASVHEPPFYADGISRDGIRDLNAEIERGDLAAAFAGQIRPLRRAFTR